MMIVDISLNSFLETHIYSHLTKHKVNIKHIALRPASYTLTYLTLNVDKVCVINAKFLKTAKIHL